MEVNLYFGAHYATNTYQYEYSKPKLERGNKATDWTPAPEDKQDRLQDITGNVGVGKTDASATEKLDVNGNVKANGFKTSTGTSTQFLMADGSVSTLTNNVTGTGTTNYIPKFTSSGIIGNSLIYDNGTNVGIGTTSPSYPLYVATQVSNTSIYAAYDIVAFSDISVKTNIRPIENVLERINKSRGVLYDRIDSGEKNNIGFIAQELEEQFPELVVENPDGTKAVKYQNAVAILFEAIKEQQKQINELKNGITN